MAMLLAILVLMSTAVRAEDWTKFSADDYGYSMLVPAGTKMVEKTWSDGWGGLSGDSDGVSVIGVAKLGAPETAEEIEKFGVQVTGIPTSGWSEVDSGKGNGWTWFKTVTATKGSTVYYGGYGVGSRGSYLIIIKTTTEDFASYRADYDAWYASIKLF